MRVTHRGWRLWTETGCCWTNDPSFKVSLSANGCDLLLRRLFPVCFFFFFFCGISLISSLNPRHNCGEMTVRVCLFGVFDWTNPSPLCVCVCVCEREKQHTHTLATDEPARQVTSRAVAAAAASEWKQSHVDAMGEGSREPVRRKTKHSSRKLAFF